MVSIATDIGCDSESFDVQLLEENEEEEAVHPIFYPSDLYEDHISMHYISDESIQFYPIPEVPPEL